MRLRIASLLYAPAYWIALLGLLGHAVLGLVAFQSDGFSRTAGPPTATLGPDAYAHGGNSAVSQAGDRAKWRERIESLPPPGANNLAESASIGQRASWTRAALVALSAAVLCVLIGRARARRRREAAASSLPTGSGGSRFSRRSALALAVLGHALIAFSLSWFLMSRGAQSDGAKHLALPLLAALLAYVTSVVVAEVGLSLPPHLDRDGRQLRRASS